MKLKNVTEIGTSQQQPKRLRLLNFVRTHSHKKMQTLQTKKSNCNKKKKFFATAESNAVQPQPRRNNKYSKKT